MSNKSYYIKNKQILNELSEYKKTGIISEKLGEIFITIATNYSKKGSFSGYTWKDEMISEAILTCIKYIKNFDIEIKNPNPFAYITTICHRAFVNYIKKQKKHSQIKDECYNKFYLIKEKDEYISKAIDYEIMSPKRKKRKKRKK